MNEDEAMMKREDEDATKMKRSQNHEDGRWRRMR